MKSRSLLMSAVLITAMLALVACKKPPEPSTPQNPDPKAAAQADEAGGRTTNFETPAKPGQ